MKPTLTRYSLRHRLAVGAPGGFSLMELMLALAIAMVLITIGMRMMGGWGDVRELREPADKIKIMAKKAWHRAISEQRDWEVLIRARSIELRPAAAKNQDDAKFLAQGDQALGRGSGTEREVFKDSITLFLKPFGDETRTGEFEQAVNYPWVFQSSGLCEPLKIQVVREEGDQRHWVEMHFDPLTAGVQFEEED